MYSRSPFGVASFAIAVRLRIGIAVVRTAHSPIDKAKALWDRFEFVYTPKHGSWLNMAEIELNVLMKQCLNRRIDKLETIKKEVEAWQKSRNNKNAKINWQFTTEDARVKLKRLYPSSDT